MDRHILGYTFALHVRRAAKAELHVLRNTALRRRWSWNGDSSTL